MKKIFGALSALALLFAADAALAQSTLPQVPTVGTTDLFLDVTNGFPTAQSQFATAAQIAGVPGFVNGGAVVTAFTFTFGNSQTDYFVQPAGTLATGTLTAAPNPSNGQRECFLSTQIQTALTFTANTGQTVNAGTLTTQAALTPACWTYVTALATWFRSP